MPHPHRASIWLSFAMGLAFFALIIVDVDAWTLLVDHGRRAVSVSLLGKEVGGARDRAYLEVLLELLLPSVDSASDEAAGWVSTTDAPLTESIFALHARLKDHLESLLVTHEAGFSVSVGGEPIVTVPTAGEAREVVTGLVARFTPQAVDGETIKDLSVRATERLVVEPSLSPRAAVMSGSDALSYLLAGTRERKSYTVESGDTLWEIANSHGMGLDELFKANPGITAQSVIRPGQSLSLIVPKPLVTVEATYVRIYRRAIPYPVSITWDDKRLRTDVRVDRDGSVGEKEITERMVRRNGEVTGTSVLNEAVLRWPQTQYLTAGTRRTPEDVLGDSIAEGEVTQLTSTFGQRWGRVHAGVDWAVPQGTPVHAWRDGTVKFAGVVVGYGRLVILEHPGDLNTYYAHLSRFAVGYGAAVGAGQVIAYSGNTGNSTGPHLHFEIREKGALLDPLVVLTREKGALGGP